MRRVILQSPGSLDGDVILNPLVLSFSLRQLLDLVLISRDAGERFLVIIFLVNAPHCPRATYR